MKNYVTADIGACTVELASTGSGKGSFTQTPNNLVQAGSIVSYEAMAQHIAETLKKDKISGKEAVVVLPSSKVSTRIITLPAMKHEEITLNLPYEFREYVGSEEKDYIYDYAVLETINGDDGKPLELNVLAAAVPKKVVKSYMDMMKSAGLKLQIAAPEEMGYCNLVRHYLKNHPEDANEVFFFVDLGHTSTKIHVLRGSVYSFGRTVDVGGQDIDNMIAAMLKVDDYMAHEYKEKNHGDCQSLSIIQETYDRIAIEIMRAANFFQYSNADAQLKKIYVCGGGRNLSPLMDTILQHNQGVVIADVRSIYPSELQKAEMPLTPAVLGIALQ